MSYGYILTFANNNTTVENVQYYDQNGTLQSAMKGSGTGTSSINAFWRFDATTGYGPFRSRYVAVNLADYSSSDAPSEFGTETPLSRKAGEIAYILKPSDLTKTLAGTSITKSGKYNVMLAVPTVYYYSDGSSKLYMTDDPNFQHFSSTVRENLQCYAHTLNVGTIANPNNVTYPYLLYGVYEGAISGNKLVSQSGQTSASNKTIAEFRTYATNNEASPGSSASAGSQYGIWNFYQWTLYKMMAYTVIGDKDAYTQIGAGNTDGVRARETGAMDGLTPYYGSATASKILLEHTWGGRTEFVDAYRAVSTNKLMATSLNDKNANWNASDYGLNTDNFYDTGQTMAIGNYVSQTFASTAYWDLPKAESGSRVTHSSQAYKSTGGSSVSAPFQVGGRWTNKTDCGLGYINTHNAKNWSSENTGARLVYLYGGTLPSVDAESSDATAVTVSPATGKADFAPTITSIDGNRITIGGTTYTATPIADGPNRVYGVAEWRINGATAQVGQTVASDVVLTADIGSRDAYGIVLDYNATNTDITDVSYYDYVGDPRSAMRGSGTGPSAINAFWNFDESTGKGPFGSFYCAINLADYSSASGAPSEFATEIPLSRKAGAIAYILKPSDLTKTLKGTTITGGYNGKYNIMLAIPTVYRYVDTTDLKLYLTDDPNFEFFSSTVKSGLAARGHTVHTGDKSTASKTYKYLMVGVYQGIVKNNKLLSVGGNTNNPTGDKTIADFRTYAMANSTASGRYGITTYYQWQLCKMMMYTVLGTKDASGKLGAGCTNLSDAVPTGRSESQGPYYNGNSTAKVLFENPFGGMFEALDCTFLAKDSRNFYTETLFGEYGSNYYGTLTMVLGNAIPNTGGYIAETRKGTDLWDLAQTIGSNANMGYHSNGNDGSILAVGGAHNNSAAMANIGSVTSYFKPASSEYRLGARLAYLYDGNSIEPNKVDVRVNGEWRKATPYVRVNGNWMFAEISMNDNGTWKEPSEA